MRRSRPTPALKPQLRDVAIAVAAAGCAIAVAACGSSAKSGSTTANSSSPQFALAKCMRSHGVPNFPDPTSGPGGQGFSILKSVGSSSVTINGIAFSGPAFQAAQKACRSVGTLGAPAPLSEAQKEAFNRKGTLHPDPRRTELPRPVLRSGRVRGRYQPTDRVQPPRTSVCPRREGVRERRSQHPRRRLRRPRARVHSERSLPE